MTIPPLLHQRLREQRIRLGLKQAQVAAIARVNPRTVIRAELRQTRNRNTLRKLADALGVQA